MCVKKWKFKTYFSRISHLIQKKHFRVLLFLGDKNVLPRGKLMKSTQFLKWNDCETMTHSQRHDEINTQFWQILKNKESGEAFKKL